MHYTNNGYFCVPKENEEEFLEIADVKSFGDNLVFSCESKGKLHYELNDCPGDIEKDIADIAEYFSEKGVRLTASVDYSGDYSGRYEIEDGEFYSYSENECIIRDAFDDDLIDEMKRRGYQCSNKKHRDMIRLDKEHNCVMWIYYNPDSVSGGQYVVNTLSQDFFFRLTEQYGLSDDLFEHVCEESKQYLIDKENEFFKIIDKKYKSMSYVGCGEEITIEYDTARCDSCGWMAADSELNEIMTP